MSFRRLSEVQVRHAVEVGLSFGLTSGVITTLGLLIGLYSGTGSLRAVVTGILTIAICDALSDAMGIHLSEESEGIHGPYEIWLATLTTFGAKFAISCSFLVPFVLLSLPGAIYASVLWGFVLLVLFNIGLAHHQKKPAMPIIVEHLGFAMAVIVLAWLAGEAIHKASEHWA